MDKLINDTPRIFCIGRNYREHINELKSETPTEPIIFIKPLTSLGGNKNSIRYPSHGNSFQHEVEIVIQIGRRGRPSNLEQAKNFIGAITLGLDLMLRDVLRDLWITPRICQQVTPETRLYSY